MPWRASEQGRLAETEKGSREKENKQEIARLFQSQRALLMWRVGKNEEDEVAAEVEAAVVKKKEERRREGNEVMAS